MKDPLELQIQALLDGELSVPDARELELKIEGDAELRGIHGELCQLRRFVRRNHPETELPETREFYWTQISRRIESGTTRTGAATVNSMAWLWSLRWPVAAVAVLALALLPLGGTGETYVEEEMPIDGVESISFHLEDNTMTVVWVDYSINTQAGLEWWPD